MILTREVARLVDVDVVAVLPPPRDLRLRTAPGRALQRHVAPLRPHLVAAREAVLDLGRH